MRRFDGASIESCGFTETGSEEIEFGAAIGLPFDELEPGDLSFDLAAGQHCHHRIVPLWRLTAVLSRPSAQLDVARIANGAVGLLLSRTVAGLGSADPMS